MNAFFGFIQFEKPESYSEKNENFSKAVLSSFPNRFPLKKMVTNKSITIAGDFEAYYPTIQNIDKEKNSLFFNGEIYNANEIAKLLGAPIQNFESNAALVYHLIAKNGLDAVQCLNGQFFIIYVDNQKIYLLNDQMGIRQIFYYHGKNILLFASEIKFLLFHPDCPKEIDWETSLKRPHPNNIYPFKSYKTWFTDILLLPEASAMAVLPEKREIKIEAYWQYKEPGRNYDYSEDKRTAEMVMEEYYNLLDDAIKIRTQNEPVGYSLLSGGLDSSAVVAMCAKYKPTETFSIITQTTYLEKTTDICKNLANDLGFKNSQFLIPTHEISFNADFWKQWIWRSESPVAHTDSLTKTLVHYAIKNNDPNVKAILTGTGSDQFNGGLARYILKSGGVQEENWENFYQQIIYKENEKFISSNDNYLWQCQDFINREYLASNSTQKIEENYWMFYVDSALHSEIFSLCWDEIRGSNYYGHETRFPFLDYRFMEFIAKIPPHLHKDLFFDKQILREPLKNKNILPEYVLNKPKAPYNFPEYDYNSKLYDFLTDDKKFMEEALGNIDQKHLVINKVALMDKIKELKEGKNSFGWGNVMQILNLCLLEKMAGKNELEMNFESLIEQPLLVKFDENANHLLEEKLSIIPPVEIDLQKILSFSENCALLYDKLKNKYFLAKNNEVAFEIEEEYENWKAFLMKIDNKTPAQEILNSLSINYKDIEEFFKIVIEEKILTIG
jgi:asparagine synthase (glutamine-hydrolysing)